jgi:prepilin-type N-terminal cleavage/methylation domain-containing protein
MSRRGFTLIELLIVVVIIGILAAIAIPKFAGTKSKAYAAAMKSDLKNLVTAQESYFSDFSLYGVVGDLEGANVWNATTGLNAVVVLNGNAALGYTVTATHDNLGAAPVCSVCVGLSCGAADVEGEVSCTVAP